MLTVTQGLLVGLAGVVIDVCLLMVMRPAARRTNVRTETQATVAEIQRVGQDARQLLLQEALRLRQEEIFRAAGIDPSRRP